MRLCNTKLCISHMTFNDLDVCLLIIWTIGSLLHQINPDLLLKCWAQSVPKLGKILKKLSLWWGPTALSCQMRITANVIPLQAHQFCPSLSCLPAVTLSSYTADNISSKVPSTWQLRWKDVVLCLRYFAMEGFAIFPQLRRVVVAREGAGRGVHL